MAVAPTPILSKPAGPKTSAAARQRTIPLARPTAEPRWVRLVLLGVAATYLTVFLFLPLAAVIVEALRKGFGAYFAAIVEPDALASIRLTLLAAAIAVPLNVGFGVGGSWAIARFEFKGKACSSQSSTCRSRSLRSSPVWSTS